MIKNEQFRQKPYTDQDRIGKFGTASYSETLIVFIKKLQKKNVQRKNRFGAPNYTNLPKCLQTKLMFAQENKI